MQTTTLYGSDQPENGPDLIDFRNSDAWLGAYHEQGLTPRTARRYHRTPRPHITDLLRQHKLLSDDEFFREILARSGQEAFEAEAVQVQAVPMQIDQCSILDKLKEIKRLLILPSLGQATKHKPIQHPKANGGSWDFSGVLDESA